VNKKKTLYKHNGNPHKHNNKFYKKNNSFNKKINDDDIRQKNENDIIKNINVDALSNGVKKELSVLGPANREIVGKYLVLAMESFESNEMKIAINWIKKAVERAARISYIRRIAGVFYYNNEQYKEAIKELTTANRLLGKNDLNYMIADSYRAVGDVNKANTILKNIIDNDFHKLPVEDKVEVLIVYAAIKNDLNEQKMAKLIIKDAIKIAKGNVELVDRINQSL
jgi:tetratricopeptide (TPR) repeat protein